ncbi:Wzz/FepE/Etk N-terminal domain-containing protein [Kangiella koreensis]|uniref:Lipopolysaccharide biosynthesis protein n=1 Tax=Kangiella koreensis (strain DSM 16069 / JCM 12317 / KCTC 12182 / SW-125) TaxID=523791 RepID=C7RAP5_KANKD|nr:Wzz/FepE/Etk N-terminal domain-containing protein [Kangiella koreensis]ACV26337.1 lipopolysaccharide biosynthesis protein [Kangiella koreensis DSM 16069]
MNQDNNQQNIPTQGYYPPQSRYQEEEIDLRELFSIIWQGKWLIIAITIFFAIGSVALALWLPNEYKATAIVQPNDSGRGGKLASLSGQFGGLASLAGVNLGAAESTDAVIAIEIMNSWGFAEQFIDKHELDVPLFAAEGWEESTDQLQLDEDIYDPQRNEWVRQAPKGKTVEPTSWELYEQLRKRLLISQDAEKGLVNISVTHYSPRIAKQWTDWLVQDINEHMKERALKEANESIKYLEEQINQTSVAEIRAVFSELIQEQHKTKMLAQVSDEYVFKTVSEAKAPEEKDKPKRALICIIGTLLGGFLSLFIVLMSGLYKREKRLVKD